MLIRSLGFAFVIFAAMASAKAIGAQRAIDSSASNRAIEPSTQQRDSAPARLKDPPASPTASAIGGGANTRTRVRTDSEPRFKSDSRALSHKIEQRRKAFESD